MNHEGKITMEEKITAIFNNINDEILSYSGSNMTADGIVDSFGLIEIISQLEDTFDIEIDAADVTDENFGNKDRIIAFVTGLINK